MLQEKTVLLGVTGGIAAYKAAALCSALVKQHAAVEVIMTEHATEFIAPLTFEQLTGRRAIVNTFDRNFTHQVEHISLAHRTDLVLIAPATANICAKLAHGMADDMLTTTVLACKCPKLIAPAMNTNMYENPVTQDNLALLRRYGWEVIEPAAGRLACGDVGKGKMPEPEDLLQHVLHHLALPHDLTGKRILVTAGPTQESLDPVRYLTNHSTGKMGYAIARAARNRGAAVTLLSGPVELAPPVGVEVVNITTTRDLYEAALRRAPEADVVIQAAAPADFRPAQYAQSKIKKSGEGMRLDLAANPDVARALGEAKREGQILVAFAAETNDLRENARGKLLRKNADLIVANDVTVPGAGFGTDTNCALLITRAGETEVPLCAKGELAERILDCVKELRHG